MNRRFLFSIFSLISSFCLIQVAVAQNDAQPSPSPSPDMKAKSVRVAVLGYHEFGSSSKTTAMLLPVKTFRKQLQTIKDENLNVISLEDFIAWKKGKKTIPDKSILITIDDGWKSVYTHAYPVLKEFDFPFTVYLYKNYVDGGGKALTSAMIREMQKNGCTIGCHSTSHPYPSKVKKHRRMGKEAYDTFLEKEMGDSKKFLEKRFKQKITTYVYPGGFHTPEMYDKADTHGYDFLFTVMPGKVKLETENHLINRYVIQGTHDYIFTNAITFRNTAAHSADVATLRVTTAHPVLPAPATSVETRTPMLSADLSKVQDLDPSSLKMYVSGFGKVPAKLDPKQRCSWKVTRPLHSSTVEVIVKWKLKGKNDYQSPLKWTFLVDKEAAYLPRTPQIAPPTTHNP